MIQTSRLSRLWQPFLLEVLLLLLSLRAGRSRTQRFPVEGDDSDRLNGLGAQLQLSGHALPRQTTKSRPPSCRRKDSIMEPSMSSMTSLMSMKPRKHSPEVAFLISFALAAGEMEIPTTMAVPLQYADPIGEPLV